MDLLKRMIVNRHEAGVVSDPKPRSKAGRKKPSKTERAKALTPGSKEMKAFICEEKPNHKIVKEHLQAIVDEECATSSDED